MTIRPVAASLACLAALAFAQAPARANGLFHRDTVYAAPVETVLAVPTAYVATSYATTYLSPTYYVSPTAYLSPTAYVVPTVSYRAAARPIYTSRIYGRPVVATSRVYDSLVLPTVYSSPVVATSRVVYDLTPTVYDLTPTAYAPSSVVATAYDPCCDTAPAVATAARSVVAPARVQAPLPPPVDRAPVGGTITSEPGLGSTRQEAQTQLPPATDDGQRSTAAPAAGSGSPPAPSEPSNLSPAPVSPLTNPPPVPANDPALPDITPAPIEGETRYEARRPVIPTPVIPGMTPLKGRVYSQVDGRPEAGVRVIARDRLRRFLDRTATTDAEGRYEIRLPDGDWQVQVVANSGRAYEVSRVTVAGGTIVDDQDRTVALLRIDR